MCPLSQSVLVGNSFLQHFAMSLFRSSVYKAGIPGTVAANPMGRFRPFPLAFTWSLSFGIFAILLEIDAAGYGSMKMLCLSKDCYPSLPML
ncbi:hypothetical protein LY78DRAFT_448870 [Colletotrichum sublineola]|nr:hypothetical protein LY78DRAFT_448870 [Colletotrichum sublineola]